MRGSRVVLLVFWLLFVGYALVLAPGGRGGEDPHLLPLLTLSDEHPLLLAVFSLLGLFPMAYAALLLREDSARKPAWPFSLAAFGLGAFALIPYYIVNRSLAPEVSPRVPGTIASVIRSRSYLIVVSLLTLGVIGYGLGAGRVSELMDAMATSQFVHVMTIDLVVLWLFSIYCIRRDARRSGGSPWLAWLGLLPIIGLCLYVGLGKTREGGRLL